MNLTILNMNKKQFQAVCKLLSKMGYEPIELSNNKDVWGKRYYD